MAASTKQAHEQVVAARRQLRHELDELRSAGRSAVDIPAKVRRNPVKTIGLAGGAGFLAVGGPKRILRAVERRVRPTRQDRLKGILPKDVERIIDRTAENAEQVRQRLEQDFHDWMSKKRPQVAPSGARQSFWKTYDALVGPIGALAAKSLAGRLFAAEPKRRPDGNVEKPGDVTMDDLATAEVGKKIAGG
jgi:ElaB/YqjD/DUF883 family membrane-anchored ribosome-binding protein